MIPYTRQKKYNNKTFHNASKGEVVGDILEYVVSCILKHNRGYTILLCQDLYSGYFH